MSPLIVSSPVWFLSHLLSSPLILFTLISSYLSIANPNLSHLRRTFSHLISSRLIASHLILSFLRLFLLFCLRLSSLFLPHPISYISSDPHLMSPSRIYLIISSFPLVSCLILPYLLSVISSYHLTFSDLISFFLILALHPILAYLP